ncbi:zinc finger BED domain-containing protein 4-like [Xyrauchen texanus]|uniref:zinc finger BED domain-containing protein 4-like n=1 Tax=Xyrauchen texanus TaxID=154827 RepID=UPI0022422B9D|nr:zinc finger BED domain-containing protein 4-like [Xyrauchen texanus]
MTECKRIRVSKVWESFTKLTPKNAVVCNICKAELAFHGSTTCMLEHLKMKHPGTREAGESSKKSSGPIDDFFLRRNSCTPQQATALTESILNMIVKDMRPLSLVDGEGFREMVSTFNPGYIIPSRTYFTRLMEQKYEKTCQKVKETIQEGRSFIALTTDIWTSLATEEYLGVTCHFITEDWKMTSLTLATMPLDERHTGVNIATWLEEVVTKFNISVDNIKAVVHENGSNVVAALKLLAEKHKWVSVRYTGHTLQLIVNNSLKETSIGKALGAARSLVEHFRRSELANTKLKEKQQQMNTPEHKLIQDVTTRWNSTYFMVERLLEQRWPVTATLSDPEVTPRGKHYFDLKPDQWSLLEELTQGLQPFQCATEFLSGQEYTTLSCLPQLAKGLQRSVQQSLIFETTPGKVFFSQSF